MSIVGVIIISLVVSVISINNNKDKVVTPEKKEIVLEVKNK